MENTVKDLQVLQGYVGLNDNELFDTEGGILSVTLFVIGKTTVTVGHALLGGATVGLAAGGAIVGR